MDPARLPSHSRQGLPSSPPARFDVPSWSSLSKAAMSCWAGTENIWKIMEITDGKGDFHRFPFIVKSKVGKSCELKGCDVFFRPVDAFGSHDQFWSPELHCWPGCLNAKSMFELGCHSINGVGSLVGCRLPARGTEFGCFEVQKETRYLSTLESSTTLHRADQFQICTQH